MHATFKEDETATAGVNQDTERLTGDNDPHRQKWRSEFQSHTGVAQYDRPKP